LLHGTGFRAAARTAYAEAVARHPGDPMSHVNLGNVLYESGEFPLAREHYETALRLEPGHKEAHQGLAYALAELGDEESARWHRRQAFEDRPVLALPYRGEGPPVSLLLLVSSVGGNIPTRQLLDDRVFRTFVVVPEFYDLQTPLRRIKWCSMPLAMPTGPGRAGCRAIRGGSHYGEGDQSPFGGAGDRPRRSCPVSRLPGVVTPATVTLPRELLALRGRATLARHGFRFPLLVRTPGFSHGAPFLRVGNPEALAGSWRSFRERN